MNNVKTAFFAFLAMAMMGCSGSNLPDDLSGVWRGETDGAMVEIDLASKAPSVTVAGNKTPVTIDAVDKENEIVTMLAGNPTMGIKWSAKKVALDDGTFVVHFTTHTGANDTLMFVRNL